jgi:tellurite resistance protein TerC
MAETPLAFEIITFVVLALFFIVDLFVIGRRPHVPSTKECVQHIAFFVVMALIFGGCIWFFAGSKPAIEFYSGWLTEYSLSIDNLFVFVIIMSNFAVPKQIQKYVLSIGITIALIFRGIFILIGAALISRFTWVFFLFGAFLIYTAVKLVLGGDEDEEYHENGIIRNLRKIIKITDDYDGEKLRTTKNGVRYWTPMLIVFLTIGTTDVMFAFDSIPAIFGLTKDPFLVFTSNVFALLGLQQLYFLLGALLDKLVYLPAGLSVVKDRGTGWDNKVASNVKVLESQSANWSTDEAKTVTAGLLDKYKSDNPQFIFAQNDEMGLGAAQAVDAAGLKGKVKIITIDGTKNALQALVDGDLSYVIEYNPIFGKETAQAVKDYLDGKTVEKDIEIESKTFEAASAKEALDNNTRAY